MRYKLNGVTLLGRKVARHGGELHEDARTESSQKRELREHPINIPLFMAPNQRCTIHIVKVYFIVTLAIFMAGTKTKLIGRRAKETDPCCLAGNVESSVL